jgi:mono/diheme cytochrome c family protein
MPIAIQNRVLLGITFFVGIMLLIGWIAINEPARMEVFTAQYAGRSIENGAALYLNNCATCHGVDGLGGQGPGLKNPMLFLDRNPATDKQNEITELTTVQNGLNAQINLVADNQKKIADLDAQIAAETDATKKAQLEADKTAAQNALNRAQDNLEPNKQRLAEVTARLATLNTELTDLTAKGWVAGRLPRLKEVNWGGTLQAYIANAVAAGRPLSGSYWNGVIMPTWGQQYGGPMRPDEVADVTAYVMNWVDQGKALTPADVRVQFIVPGAGGGTAAVDPNKKTVFAEFGKKEDASVADLGDLSGGDATKGAALYNANACAGCHNIVGGQGPLTKGTWFRTLSERIKVPENAGLPGDTNEKKGESYLAQSILYPNHYLTPNYGAGVMPQNFGDLLSIGELKDLIAYLKTYNTP